MLIEFLRASQFQTVQPGLVTDGQVGPGVEEEDGDVVVLPGHGVVQGRVALLVNTVQLTAGLHQLLHSNQPAGLHCFD